MLKDKLNVVLLCYKEAENLNILLPKIISVLSTCSLDYEIIVIDTLTSKDNTFEICEKYSTSYFNRIPTDAYGDAFRTAIRKLNGTLAIFMDADGSHSPEFIPVMLQAIKNNSEADLVIASRYMTGGNSENQKLLVLMSKILNFLYSIVLGIKCKDVSNSFRLYKTSLLTNLKLECNHFDILEETLFRIKQKKHIFNLIEVPFLFKKRLFGDSKRKLMVFIFNYFKTLVKLLYLRLFSFQTINRVAKYDDVA